MKILIFMLLLGGCSNLTNSIHRCDKKVGPEKETCIESYRNFDRHLRYMDFRGGGHNVDRF